MEEKKVKFTTKEAIEAGLPMKAPAPEPVNCRFCSRELYYEGVAVFGMIWVWFKDPQRCTCKEAIEYWEKKDIAERIKREKEAEKEAQRRAEEHYKWQLERSKMSRRLIKCSEDAFEINKDNQKANNKVKKYIASFRKYKESGNGLYICGSCGSGKTHLAATMAITLIKKEYYVIMQPCVDMLKDLKDAFGSPKNDSEIMREYLECDLLVLDDVGKEQCTEWSLTTLYRIINHRYNQLKPVVITSNYEPEELVKRLTVGSNSSSAEAIVSRIYECCDLIPMNGADYRKTVLKKNVAALKK